MEGCVDLTKTRCRFLLTGEDRVRYLNGQVTNQVERASEETAIQACVCNHKGKLDGVIFISANAGALQIDGPIELRDHLYARLAKYIIADDAELEDVTDETTLVHEIGASEGIQANRFGTSGRDQWTPATCATPIEDDTLEQNRIEHRIPKWGAEMTHETLPAEVGLHLTAVDFHKGCYLGQEVVSRIQSVGRVNKQLVGLSLSGGDAHIGDALYAADDDERSGKPLGTITSIAPDRSVALSVLRHTHAEPETKLVSVSQDGNLSGESQVRAR